MFLEWAAQLGVLSHDDESNILGKFPLDVRRIIVDKVTTFLLDPTTKLDQIILTMAHARFICEVIGQGFSLPIEDATVINNSVEVYRRWLELPNKPPIIAQNDQYFYRIIFKHYSLAFAPRAGNVNIEGHARICGTILTIFETAGRRRPEDFTVETWTVMLKVLVSVADSFLTNSIMLSPLIADFAKLLCPQMLSVVFELFVRSQLTAENQEAMWSLLSDRASRWTQWMPTIMQWSATLQALTMRVNRLTFGPSEGTDQIQLNVNGRQTNFDLPDQNLVQIWFRTFYVLGNPNTIENAANFVKAVENVTKISDMLIAIGNNRGAALKLVKEVNIPQTLNGNSILALVGPWLFEACRPKYGLEKGRAIALGAVARIFSTKTTTPFKPSYLAQFYQSIEEGLNSADGGCICSILMNTTSLFSCPLEGVNILIPTYIATLRKLLPLKDPEFQLSVPRQNIRAAGINIVSTLICLGNHYSATQLLWPFETDDKKRAGVNTFGDMRAKLVSILIEGLHSETFNRNLKLLLWSLCVNLYDDIANSKELPFRTITALQSGLDTWPVDVVLTALEALASLVPLQKMITAANEFAIRNMMLGLCRFIDSLLSAKEQRFQVLEAVKIIECAYDTLAVWAVEDQWLLRDDDCLKAVLTTVENGNNLCRNFTGDAETEKALGMSASDRIHLAAENTMYCVMQRTGQFPMPLVGPSSVSSVPTEADVLPRRQDGSVDMSWVRYFLIDDASIVSLVDRRNDDGNSSPLTLVARTGTGRYVWNMDLLYTALSREGKHAIEANDGPEPQDGGEGGGADGAVEANAAWTVTEHELPELDGVLEPEMQTFQVIIDKLSTAQRVHTERGGEDARLKPTPPVCVPPRASVRYDTESKFQTGRLIMQQLGLISLESRSRVTQLENSEKFQNLLSRLDALPERECERIGVLYIRRGQTTEAEFLGNQGGSADFQAFCSTLGWNVDVATHVGFSGGMAGSSFKTARYYCNLQHEVIYHVSTQHDHIPGREPSSMQPLIFGDYVVIVWTEEIDDMLTPLVETSNIVYIYIHALPNGMYRIRITSKNMAMPLFGPLLSGMTVSKKTLGLLARETALNASYQARQLVDGFSSPLVTRRKVIRELQTEKKYINYASMFV